MKLRKRAITTEKNPMLVSVIVDPVMFEGRPVQHRLLMKFAAGHGFVDILVEEGEDGAAIEKKAIEIRRALGIG